MKVASIDLYSDDVKAAELDLSYPDPTDSYILKASVGLDAGEIIRKFKTIGLVSKKRYHDLVQRPKDIILKVGLNPNYRLGETNSDLRDSLYRTLASTNTGLLELRLINDTPFVISIFGYLTKFEASLFTDKPEVLITMRCEDAMFRSKTEIEVDVSDIIIPDISIDDFISTAPHGFKFSVYFEGASTSFILQDALVPDWKFEIDYAFGTGDILEFSSESNNRYITIFDGITSETIHALDKLVSGSVWPLIHPGVTNNFYTPNTNYHFNSISYYPSFWGV